MGITTELCDRITAMSAADLDEAVVAAGKRLVLDGIAVAIAGAALEEAPKLLGGYYRDQDGHATSSVLGQGFSLPAPQAALVNGAAMHVLDFEPMWLPSTHALSPALSAALALAEPFKASGGDVLAAVVKGIELQMAILTANGHVESRNLRFHPPGMVGPLGAAVAASHILRLDAATLAQALGIVSSRCGGLFSNIGTMTKATHCGYAAFFGVEAALLASRGFTANGEMFDAKKQSYMQAFMTENFDPQELLRFGQPFKLIDPGFAIKLFPCKFTTHYAVNAALDMHKLLSSPDEIESVEILAAEVPSADRPRPATGLEGKFSVQYTAAAGLLDGRVDLDTFTDAILKRPQMQDMLGRITLVMDRDMSSKYTAGRYLEMTTRLKDGAVLKTRCEMPRGAWGSPPPTREEHLTKVRSCFGRILPERSSEAIIDILEGFEKASAADVARLVELARGEARPAEVVHAAHR